MAPHTTMKVHITKTHSMSNITILRQGGIRSLHFGTPAVQGAMNIERPNEILLEYVQQMRMWMLFREKPGHIVQLGLGAAALTRFCHAHFPEARVTAVEIDPEVIEICRREFALPPDDERLSVLNMDAQDFVSDFSRRRSVDVLQVDLYDAAAVEPVLSSESFYAACANCLAHDGMMTVNLYCDWPEHFRHIRAIGSAFDSVAWLPIVHDANMVAIAFKRSPSIEFDQLRERAAAIHERTGLPAETWVQGLLAWMLGELDMP